LVVQQALHLDKITRKIKKTNSNKNST
jgi:hypothetical protein